MISLGVKFRGHFQYAPGTIFHAESTPFTTVVNNVNITGGNFNIIKV
jgi:hypothetical protein